MCVPVCVCLSDSVCDSMCVRHMLFLSPCVSMPERWSGCVGGTGKALGVAFRLPRELATTALFPTVLLKVCGGLASFHSPRHLIQTRMPLIAECRGGGQLGCTWSNARGSDGHRVRGARPAAARSPPHAATSAPSDHRRPLPATVRVFTLPASLQVASCVYAHVCMHTWGRVLGGRRWRWC
jgi:hypothetical protein